MDYLSFSQDISSAGWEKRLFPDLASPHFSSGFGTNKTQAIKMGLALKRGSNRGETFFTNHIMNYGGMESLVKSSARMAIPNRNPARHCGYESLRQFIWNILGTTRATILVQHFTGILQKTYFFLAFFFIYNPSLLWVPARLRSGISVEEDSPLELLIILKANKQTAFLLEDNKKEYTVGGSSTSDRSVEHGSLHKQIHGHPGSQRSHPKCRPS